MNTLATLLSHVVSVLQESGYCGAVRVLEYELYGLSDDEIAIVEGWVGR